MPKAEHGASGTDFLPHFSSNMRQSLFTVETLGLKPPITKHLGDLGVFLSVFTEDKFSLVVVVFILSTSPILSTLGTKIASHLWGAKKAARRILTFPLF